MLDKVFFLNGGLSLLGLPLLRSDAKLFWKCKQKQSCDKKVSKTKPINKILILKRPHMEFQVSLVFCPGYYRNSVASAAAMLSHFSYLAIISKTNYFLAKKGTSVLSILKFIK